MSGLKNPFITEPAIAKMTSKKPGTPPTVIKSSPSTESSSSDGEPVADRADVEAALKIPISARDGKPGQKLIKVGIKTLESLHDSIKPVVKVRASSPAASDTSSLSSAPSDDGSETEMVNADDSDNEESPAAMSFEEKIAVATENAKQGKTCTPQKKKASLKHRITPPSSGSETKKARPATKRDRSAEASLEVQKLPYQSIISMNMPARTGVVAGEPIPEPDKDDLPFGDTEDYHNSMIIHYMDECEYTYTKAAEVYSAKFPIDAVTDEAVRKRHIRSLLRLKKKYGLRDPLSTPRPSKNVVRRGTPRAKKVSSIVPVSGLLSTPDAATTTPKAIKKEDKDDDEPGTRRPRDRRMLEKTHIVIWHDANKLDWDVIQNKLDVEYSWSIGKGTIEKYYYTSLERVYGKGGKREKNREQRVKVEDGAEEKRPLDGDFSGTVERLVERRMSF